MSRPLRTWKCWPVLGHLTALGRRSWHLWAARRTAPFCDDDWLIDHIPHSLYPSLDLPWPASPNPRQRASPPALIFPRAYAPRNTRSKASFELLPRSYRPPTPHVNPRRLQHVAIELD
ncbi:hypothetical protein IQ07DRAFT_409350 [Pyrenochaeta sp. DS3sAY3a]|nr:hypothetical protein IQ07DRAFT_409350 [Pyrenochaeta sp. DS3sAY3a]